MMNDNQERSEEYFTFSQRHGYESIPEPMRLEEISDDLRRQIWNETRQLLIWMTPTAFFSGTTRRFVERVLGRLHGTTEDNIDTEYDAVFRSFKAWIQGALFNEVLDLIELILHEHSYDSSTQRFATRIAEAFEYHIAAYCLDLSHRPYQFFPRSNKAQGEATRSAIETIRANDMEGADTHLRQAVTHINARQFADSITDSIHAVESVARTIDPKAKTLGPALDSLQRSDVLKHPALKEAFSKLYGYTNDEQGIRHALLDRGSPDVDLDEAMFMFGACASFAAYLVNKHRKAQQGKGEGP